MVIIAAIPEEQRQDLQELQNLRDLQDLQDLQDLLCIVFEHGVASSTENGMSVRYERTSQNMSRIIGLSLVLVILLLLARLFIHCT